MSDNAGLLIGGAVLISFLFVDAIKPPIFQGITGPETYGNACQKMSGNGDIWEGSIEDALDGTGTIELNDSANAQWYERNCR